MNIKEGWQHYYEHTGSASKVSRNAAYAGFAVIWIFKTGSWNSLVLPAPLMWSALFFVVALAMDLLQYVSLSLLWDRFMVKKENELGHTYEGDINAPDWLNAPGKWLFWIKILMVIIGYIVLISAILNRIQLSA